MIRQEVYDFVRLWNSHSIRPQKNRPNSVSGKPYMLYNYPGHEIKNWAVPYDKDQFRTIKDKVVHWDIDAYLPLETLTWCQTFLDSIQFHYSRNIGDRTKPFYSVYLRLRNAIATHVRSEINPQLSLLPTPIGAYNWEGSMQENNDVRAADLETDPSS